MTKARQPQLPHPALPRVRHRKVVSAGAEAVVACNDIANAEDLVAWMKRMNLSMSAAAKQLGCARNTISRYINGVTQLPKAVARHAMMIEAARRGQPFPNR